MNPWRPSGEILQLLALYAIFVSYLALREWIAGRFFFIVPVVVGLALYAYFRLRRRPELRKEVGVRVDNLRRSTAITATLTAPIAGGAIVLALLLGRPISGLGFLAAIVLYPVWGIAQQFLFQSILHTRLMRIGAGVLAIPIVAATFALVHLPNLPLVAMTGLAGLVWSYSFHRERNIVPIGVAHGLLAALVYYWILGHDVIASFVSTG